MTLGLSVGFVKTVAKKQKILKASVLLVLPVVGAFALHIYTFTRCLIILKAPPRLERNTVQLFYDVGGGYREKDSIKLALEVANDFATYDLILPSKRIRKLRIDPGTEKGEYVIRRICLIGSGKKKCLGPAHLEESFVPGSGIGSVKMSRSGLRIEAINNDPYLEFKYDFSAVQDKISRVSCLTVFLILLTLVFAISRIWLKMAEIDLKDRRSLLVVTFAIFSIGVIVALHTYKYIIFPYHNPWGIRGPLTRLQFNPLNDIARYIYLIVLPNVGVLIFLSIFHRRGSNDGSDE